MWILSKGKQYQQFAKTAENMEYEGVSDISHCLSPWNSKIPWRRYQFVCLFVI